MCDSNLICLWAKSSDPVLDPSYACWNDVFGFAFTFFDIEGAPTNQRPRRLVIVILRGFNDANFEGFFSTFKTCQIRSSIP